MSVKNPIYYNVSVVNGYNSDIAVTPANIEEINNQRVISEASARWLSVGRFSIPATTIPRLIVPIVLGQPDPLLTQYIVSFKLCTAPLVFSNITTQNVTFISQYPFAISTIDWTFPYLKQSTTNSFYFVYDVEQMLLMFNNQLQDCFQVFCASGLPVVYNPALFPYITFDYNTRLFSMNMCANDGTNNYFDQNSGVYPYIVCEFNSIASSLFQFCTTNYFNLLLPTPPPFLQTICCFNKFDNVRVSSGNTFYKMTADVSGLNIWNSFSKIVISVTFGISTVLEYDSTPVSNQGTTNNATRFGLNKPNNPTLLDFEVDRDLFSINNNWIQYQTYNISEQRLVGITADNIQNFYISVFWVDSFGIRHTLNLDQGLPLTIKLCFYDKNMKLL